MKKQNLLHSILFLILFLTDTGLVEKNARAQATAQTSASPAVANLTNSPSNGANAGNQAVQKINAQTAAPVATPPPALSDGSIPSATEKSGSALSGSTEALSVTGSKKVLNWQDCVQQTLDHSDDLKAAQNTLQGSEYLKRAAYSNFLPQISASANYSYSGTNSNSSSTTTIGSTGTDGTTIVSPNTTGNTSIYSTALTASENLFTGLLDQGKVDQAKANQKVSEANLKTVKATVSYNLKVAYAGLLYAQDSIVIDQTIVKHREENLRMIELRFESGEENKGSVLLTKANLEQAKFALLQAMDNVDTAKASLAKVLGLDDYDEVAIGGTVPVANPPAQVDYKNLTLGAPDYLQALAQEDVSDAAVTIARSGFFPTLTLTGSLANTGTTFFPDNQRWSVGAGITLPLFNGGRDYYGTKSALQNQSAAMYTKQSTYKQDISKLKTAFTNYFEAVRKLEVDRLYEEAANTRDKIGRQQYNNGLISFNDFDIIETDYITRETNLLQSEQNRIVQEAAWEQAQGKGAIP